MIDHPHISQTVERQTAVIRMVIPKADIQKVMGPAICEVMGTLTEQGLAPAGPLFSHHLRLDPDLFDFEVGVPVNSPVTATGRVVSSKLRAAKVATTVHHGPYEGLETAWGEFTDWISKQGHQPAMDVWEYYRVGPESGPDSANWETDLIQPLDEPV